MPKKKAEKRDTARGGVLGNRNVGRRTGFDVLQGKNIRMKNGLENFSDYWTDSEMEESYFDITCHEEQENVLLQARPKASLITPKLKSGIALVPMSPFSASSSNSTLPPSRNWTPQGLAPVNPADGQATPTATVSEDVVPPEDTLSFARSECETPASHSDHTGCQSQEAVGALAEDPALTETQPRTPAGVDSTCYVEEHAGDTTVASGRTCVAESPQHNLQSHEPIIASLYAKEHQHNESSTSQVISSPSTAASQEHLHDECDKEQRNKSSVNRRTDTYGRDKNACVKHQDGGQKISPSRVNQLSQNTSQRLLRSSARLQSNKASSKTAANQEPNDSVTKQIVTEADHGKLFEHATLSSDIQTAVVTARDVHEAPREESDYTEEPTVAGEDEEEEEGQLSSLPQPSVRQGNRQSNRQKQADLTPPETASSKLLSSTKRQPSQGPALHNQAVPTLDPQGDGVTGSISRIGGTTEPHKAPPCSALQNFRTRKRLTYSDPETLCSGQHSSHARSTVIGSPPAASFAVPDCPAPKTAHPARRAHTPQKMHAEPFSSPGNLPSSDAVSRSGGPSMHLSSESENLQQPEPDQGSQQQPEPDQGNQQQPEPDPGNQQQPEPDQGNQQQPEPDQGNQQQPEPDQGKPSVSQHQPRNAKFYEACRKKQPGKGQPKVTVEAKAKASRIKRKSKFRELPVEDSDTEDDEHWSFLGNTKKSQSPESRPSVKASEGGGSLEEEPESGAPDAMAVEASWPPEQDIEPGAPPEQPIEGYLLPLVIRQQPHVAHGATPLQAQHTVPHNGLAKVTLLHLSSSTGIQDKLISDDDDYEIVEESETNGKSPVQLRKRSRVPKSSSDAGISHQHVDNSELTQRSSPKKPRKSGSEKSRRSTKQNSKPQHKKKGSRKRNIARKEIVEQGIVNDCDVSIGDDPHISLVAPQITDDDMPEVTGAKQKKSPHRKLQNGGVNKLPEKKQKDLSPSFVYDDTSVDGAHSSVASRAQEAEERREPLKKKEFPTGTNENKNCENNIPVKTKTTSNPQRLLVFGSGRDDGASSPGDSSSLEEADSPAAAAPHVMETELGNANKRGQTQRRARNTKVTPIAQQMNSVIHTEDLEVLLAAGRPLVASTPTGTASVQQRAKGPQSGRKTSINTSADHNQKSYDAASTPHTITRRKRAHPARTKKRKSSSLAKFVMEDSTVDPSDSEPDEDSLVHLSGTNQSAEDYSDEDQWACAETPDVQSRFKIAHPRLQLLRGTPKSSLMSSMSTPKSILKKRHSGALASGNTPAFPLDSTPKHIHKITNSDTTQTIQHKKTVRIIPPAPAPEGLRRSRRTRVPALEWYKNERIAYKRRASGQVVVGVISPLIKSQKKKGLRRKPVRRVRRGFQALRNLSVHTDLSDNEDFVTGGDVTVLDSDSRDEVSKECLRDVESLCYMNTQGREAEDTDPLALCKVFQQPEFTVGVIRLRPLQEKGLQCVRVDSVVFSIVYGKLAVTIHETTSVLESGDFFMVPKGNVYNIRNLRNDEAHLTFYLHKG